MPDLQKKHFSSFDINDIYLVQQHGVKVMKGIDGLITEIKAENDENLVSKIHRVTRSHYRRGINSRNDFEVPKSKNTFFNQF